MDIKSITQKFGIADAFVVNELKTGHTNRTYLIECSSGKYILQSLNKNIFKNPEIVMRNIDMIEKAFEFENDIIIPHYLKCDGKIFMEQGGNIWRIYKYIENKCKYPQKEYAHGYAVGRFLNIVNSCRFEFKTPINLHYFGLELPVRNIHGDTKLDNIIFGEKPAIIDFDTAMRGYICADYGDMIRSITTEKFDLQVINDTTKGFADGIDDLLTAEEIGTLYHGIVLIIMELQERYHAGVKNFPNKTPEQCLEREKSLRLQLNEFYLYKKDVTNIINKCFE